MKSSRRMGTFQTRCGRTFPSRKFSKSLSASASWTVPITPWCSDFKGSCSRGGISSLSPYDRSGRGHVMLLSHSNIGGPPHVQITCPAVDVHLLECSVDAEAALPEADGCGAAACVRPTLTLLPFTEVWVVDFEYDGKPGENPEP